MASGHMFVKMIVFLLTYSGSNQVIFADDNDDCYSVIYGKNRYIEYQEGDEESNIILASPHGGFMKPSTIPDRGPTGCFNEKTQECEYSHQPCESNSNATCKRIVTRQDEFTRNLTLIVANELRVLRGQRPHVVLNNLHRSKLDANRPLDQASFYNYEASVAWHEFSMFILQAKQRVKARSIFFDIHRQRHRENWVELGYRIQTGDLISGNYTYKDSSIRYLAERNLDKDFDEFLSGNLSLGYFLENKGYKSTPSPSYPLPNPGGYYRGGYNTYVYGSQMVGDIDGIQIESPMILMNEKKGVPYGKALAKAIHEFMDENYKRRTKLQPSRLRMCDSNESNNSIGASHVSRNLHLGTSLFLLSIKRFA